MSLRKADGRVVEFPCKGCVVQRPSHDQASLVAIQLDQFMQLQAMSQKLDELNTEIRRRRQVEEQLREHSAKLEQDITERMLAEEALRESEQKFRTLAEALPQIVWITGPDGRNIYYNQQWVDFTGLTLEESSGHDWSIPLQPDDQQRVRDAWQHAIQTDGV